MYTGNISSILSRNSEAFASEFLKSIEGIVLWHYNTYNSINCNPLVSVDIAYDVRVLHFHITIYLALYVKDYIIIISS